MNNTNRFIHLILQSEFLSDRLSGPPINRVFRKRFEFYIKMSSSRTTENIHISNNSVRFIFQFNEHLTSNTELHILKLIGIIYRRLTNKH